MKNKRITAAHRRRFDIIKFEIGCLIHFGTPAQAHHLLSGSNRISHDHTIPLCPMCHGLIHARKKWFAEKYGDDEFLLKLTNKQVEDFEGNTVNGS
jgi:hypothetical protein